MTSKPPQFSHIDCFELKPSKEYGEPVCSAFMYEVAYIILWVFHTKAAIDFLLLIKEIEGIREKQPLSFRSDDGQEGIIFKQKLSWVIWSYLIGKCAKGIAQGADSPYNELDTV